jgi:hypothetical protein
MAPNAVNEPLTPLRRLQILALTEPVILQTAC